MKTKIIASAAALLLAALPGAKAATTLAAWTFDNDGLGANNTPAYSAGPALDGTVGSGISGTIVSLPGSSSGLANSWQLSGFTTGGAIGSQGGQFAVTTVGYYQVQVSFDVYATVNA
jgi:hypothetical protein